ncbi:hypothetical protein K227x_27060 [Rubripirellula lacrimiformis]|uniref:DUF1499 domain-containing protein n=2 Tax=Rubripirellula lacrimiformis TaxID=1930273 RepID=A0A517NB04_9BACT|nr:hypothetical protein K227x_27060 [Rubripirellula lacrimiformis]
MWLIAIPFLGWACMNFNSIVRGLTTNHAALSDTASDPQLRPLEIDQQPQAVADRIRNWVSTQSGWTLESDDSAQADDLPQPVGTPDQPVRLHLVRRTRFFGFADDINVSLEPTDQGTRVQAESQSRLGKGDLGQNPRNLRELVGAIQSE